MRTEITRTGSRELLAVGIFGGTSLGDRIEMLLKRGREFSPRVSRRRVGTSILLLLMFAIAGSRAPRWIAFAQQPDRPSFEVASIKASDPNDRQVWMLFKPGGRFSTTNATLQMLIGNAYDVRNHQISGGPNWLTSTKFNIEAKAVSEVPIPQMRLMIQTLLAERFELALHRETREEQVYELVVDKGGSKLKEATDSLNANQQGIYGARRGEIAGTATTVPLLAMVLSQWLGRSVIDKTGLAGKYDFTLHWNPSPAGVDRDGSEAPPPPDPNGPSLFTVVQEDLGLRLQSAKGPVEILVIDHVEKPSEN
jgi:uncharacterized protein (TIGR03435 family)